MKKSELNWFCSFELSVICQQKGMMLDSFGMYILSIDEVRFLLSVILYNDYDYILKSNERYVSFTIAQIIAHLNKNGVNIFINSSGLLVVNRFRFKDVDDAIAYAFSLIEDINTKEVSILHGEILKRAKIIK